MAKRAAAVGAPRRSERTRSTAIQPSKQKERGPPARKPLEDVTPAQLGEGYVNEVEDEQRPSAHLHPAEAEFLMNRAERGSEVSPPPGPSITVEPQATLRSPGVYSGTTARTSGTPMHGQARLPIEKKIDNLAELDDAAARLVDLLTPIQNSNEALAKAMQNFQGTTRSAGRAILEKRDQLHGVRKTYIDKEPFFNVPRVVGELIPNRNLIKPGFDLWRPDDIFFRANLALAAEDVFESFSEEKGFNLSFESLDRGFPDRFLCSVETVSPPADPQSGTTYLFEETFEVGLAIRAQYAISVLVDRLGEIQGTPANVLRDIFTGDGLGRGWEVKGLQSADLTPTQREQILDCRSQIQRAFDGINKKKKAGENPALHELRQVFPVHTFVRKYLTWIRARSLEIDTYLASVGKVFSIQERIEELTEQSGVALQSSSARSHRSRVSEGGSSKLTPSKRIALSKAVTSMSPTLRAQAWRNDLGREQPVPVTRTNRSHTQRPSNLRRSIILAEGEQPQETATHEEAEPQQDAIASDPILPVEQPAHSLPTEQIKRMTLKFRSDAAQVNKENALPVTHDTGIRYFNARQENAERLQFDTQTPEGDALRAGTIEASAESDDPSQDAGFEQDQRNHSKPSKRQAERSHRSLQSKRVRTGPLQDTEASSSNARPRGIVPANPSADTTSETLAQPSATAQNYTQVVQQAKDRIAIYAIERPAQLRVPWSEEEVSYLHNKIEEVGTSWSQIKNSDSENILWRRDQVAIKDKARNMLFNYLKSGKDIPHNFLRIALSGSQKNQLHNLGVPVPPRLLQQ